MIKEVVEFKLNELWVVVHGGAFIWLPRLVVSGLHSAEAHN